MRAGKEFDSCNTLNAELRTACLWTKEADQSVFGWGIEWLVSESPERRAESAVGAQVCVRLVGRFAVGFDHFDRPLDRLFVGANVAPASN